MHRIALIGGAALAKSPPPHHNLMHGRSLTGRIRRASRMPQELSEAERAEIGRQVERLREEHRDLDAAIEALTHTGAADRLQMQRIKKRKLSLRDRLAALA